MAFILEILLFLHFSAVKGQSNGEDSLTYRFLLVCALHLKIFIRGVPHLSEIRDHFFTFYRGK